MIPDHREGQTALPFLYPLWEISPMDSSRTGECLRKLDVIQADVLVLLTGLRRYVEDNLDSEADLSHEELFNYIGALDTNLGLHITNMQSLKKLLTAVTRNGTI